MIVFQIIEQLFVSETPSEMTSIFFSKMVNDFCQKAQNSAYYTQNNYIPEKRTIKKCFVSKWRSKKQIVVSQKKSRDQNLENHFPKGIFQ